MPPLVGSLFFCGPATAAPTPPQDMMDVSGNPGSVDSESDGDEGHAPENRQIQMRPRVADNQPRADNGEGKFAPFSKGHTTALDQRIKELRQQAFDFAAIEAKLKEEGFFNINAKYIAGRWRKISELDAKLEEERLSDELTDWHEGDDEKLEEAYVKAEVDIRRQLERVEEYRWKAVSQHMAEDMGRKKFNAKACRKRYEALKDGTADVPFEKDDDQEGRAAKSKQRVLEAKQRRRDLAESARLSAEEKAQRLADAKQNKIAKAKDIAKFKQEKAAERQARSQVQREIKMGKERTRASRKAGLAYLKAQITAQARIREDEDRVYTYYTGRKTARKQPRSKDGAAGGKGGDPDDEENMEYLLDSDEDEATTAPVVTMTPAVVSRDTLRNARSIMSDHELDILLFERGLARRGPEESHPEVVARLAAADEHLSTTALDGLLGKHFVPLNGSRLKRIARLQKADADESAAGKEGLTATDPAFIENYAGYKGDYAHLSETG